jgi:hypothetical protein
VFDEPGLDLPPHMAALFARLSTPSDSSRLGTPKLASASESDRRRLVSESAREQAARLLSEDAERHARNEELRRKQQERAEYDERRQMKALEAADRIELLKFNITGEDLDVLPQDVGAAREPESAIIYDPVGLEAAPEDYTGSAITLQNPSRPVRQQYLELVHGLPTVTSEPILTQMHPAVAAKARDRRKKLALVHLQPTLSEVTAAATSYCQLDAIVKAAEARAAAAEAFFQQLQRHSSAASDGAPPCEPSLTPVDVLSLPLQQPLVCLELTNTD